MRNLLVGIVAMASLMPLLAFAQTGSCPNLTRNLSLGSRGADVVQLQNFLISQQDLAAGNNTGYFGKLTQTAVQKWQCKNMQICSGSPASNGWGSVGPKTRATIARVCSTAKNVTNAQPTGQQPSGNQQYYFQGVYGAAPSYSQGAFYSQASYTVPGYSQGAYYSQATYAAPYSQASYTTNYSQATYYSQGSYVTSYSQATYYSQSSYAPATDVFADKHSCTAKVLAGTQSTLIAAFDVHMADIGDSYSLQSNRQGALANNEPSYLDALLDAYKATNNDKYLQRFIVHGDRVIAHRDDKAGYTDYRGRSAATWSDNAYSSGGQYVSFLVEDGGLIAPLAHFAAIVKNTACLKAVKDAQGRTLDSIADTYVKAAGETFVFHLENWHTGTANGNPIGYYTWPSDANFTAETPGKPVAMNYHAAMGSAVTYLYAATKNSSYLDYAKYIGNFILTEMGYKYSATHDAYAWPYHPQMPYAPGYGVTEHTFADDLGHSTLTAEFARAMHEQGLGVFYSAEMQKIAHAYSRRVYNTGTIPIYIDGTGGSAGNHVYQFARVAMLTPYDGSLWSLAYDVAVTRLHTDQKGNLGSLGAFTGLARLIRYYPQ